MKIADKNYFKLGFLAQQNAKCSNSVNCLISLGPGILGRVVTALLKSNLTL
jgi:hypothetical protein